MAAPLGKMVLDALEGVANKAGMPIEEVLKIAQGIAEQNLVKMEPAEAGETVLQVKPTVAVAAAAALPAKASSSKSVAPQVHLPKAAIPQALASSSQAPVASSSKSAAPKASSSKALSSKASSFKAPSKTAVAVKGKQSAPKTKGPVPKKTASKAKAPASDSDTAASEGPANEVRANQFSCEFPGCTRDFVHRSSRTRHYKLNHDNWRP
ncbi:hypothetical protein QIS74_10963 [Colletotrichum tabaci]|uniref:C2H2-type domain-containing protein n=1 Tax=Colletotrichum tabaci TaxID=1209068 RepID=A0AAV9T2L8_9PEZI